MVDKSVPIRLCIFQAMKSSDISKQQSALLKEAVKYGRLLDKVVLVHFYKSFTKKKISENVTLITIPYIEPKSPIRLIISVLVSYIVSFPSLFLILARYKINLIRADDIVVTAFPSLLISFICRSKLVVNILGNTEEVLEYKVGSKKSLLPLITFMVKSMERLVIRTASACIAVNGSILEKVKRYGAKKSYICYPNMDLSIFLKNRINIQKFRVFTVLFVGRLEPEKGAMNVIHIARNMKDLNFLIAGYGTQELHLSRAIQEMKLSNVKLLGMVNHDDLPSLYSQCHVLILPSYTEGVPVVIFEAMASGIPVVVSDVGAVKEILKEDNGGFVVPVGSVSEMVSKIRLIEKNDELREELGNKGRIFVESTFNDYIENQIKIFENVLEK